MANPNIATATSIYGNNSTLSSFGVATVVTNAAASGKVYKINSIIAVNTSTTTSYQISLYLNRTGIDSGYITYNMAIPKNTFVVITDETTGIYLKENQNISANVSGGTINIVASWEEIS